MCGVVYKLKLWIVFYSSVWIVGECVNCCVCVGGMNVMSRFGLEVECNMWNGEGWMWDVVWG